MNNKGSTALITFFIALGLVLVGGVILYIASKSQVAQYLSVPSITITYPSGGEIWKVGSIQTIRWTSQNLPQNAHIRLSLHSASLGEGPVIAQDISIVNNSYSFTVVSTPGQLDTASDYKLTADVYTGPTCGLYPVMGGNCSGIANILTTNTSDALLKISK